MIFPMVPSVYMSLGVEISKSGWLSCSCAVMARDDRTDGSLPAPPLPFPLTSEVRIDGRDPEFGLLGCSTSLLRIDLVLGYVI